MVWLYSFQKKNNKSKSGISVVICSRNDFSNLKKNLPFFLNQDYPEFEVIVVDDASEDETWQYLQEVSGSNKNLKPIHVNAKNSPGKKQALRTGISNATHSYVLLSDADCCPQTRNWISSHSQFIHSDHTMVLGYGKHEKTKGFLNLLQRFDTATIAIQYMNSALWKYPYMGVGRNMGYTKDLIISAKDSTTALASGDDDLFVQAIKHKAHFKVNAEKESFTTSPAKKTWKEWLNQKGRHTTTAPYYSFVTKLGLMQQWLTGLLLYLGIFIIFLTGNWVTALTLFWLNALCILLFNSLWMSKLAEKDLILLSPILNIIYIFVQPAFVIKSLGRNKEKWS